MQRVDKLKEESNESYNDNNTVVDTRNGTNSINNNSDNNTSAKCESTNESNQLQCQIAEEKADAKIFPLNLISNKFKSKDSYALKGKSIINLHNFVYINVFVHLSYFVKKK